jgi:lysophospholipase L1-like esterase
MSSTFLKTSYGFFLGRQTSHAERRAVVQNGTFRNFTVGNRKLAELRRLAAELRSQGRRVIIVNMPLAPEGVEFLGGSTVREGMAAAVRRTAAEAGATYLDAGAWDQSLFADPIHLNAAGASRLSELINPILDA